MKGRLGWGVAIVPMIILHLPGVRFAVSLWTIFILCPAAQADELHDARAVLASKGCSIRSDQSGQIVRLSSARSKVLADEDMAAIGRLTTLKWLNLHQNDITDAGFRQLAPITDLEELTANLTLITDASATQMIRWKNLRSLSLPPTFTDDGVRQLGGLVNIEDFSVGGPGITDRSIDTILGFQGLRKISLGGRITPAGFQRLSALPNLHSIWMWDWMGDDMMPVFAKFPKLTQLSLNATRVTEAGLPHLRTMQALRTLALPKDTSDDGLAHIAGLVELERLDLRYSRITTAGLPALQKLTALRALTLPATAGDAAVAKLVEYRLTLSSLNLIGPTYTDACVPSLIALRSANNFGLWKTSISPAGFAQLKQARPDVQISR